MRGTSTNRRADYRQCFQPWRTRLQILHCPTGAIPEAHASWSARVEWRSARKCGQGCLHRLAPTLLRSLAIIVEHLAPFCQSGIHAFCLMGFQEPECLVERENAVKMS